MRASAGASCCSPARKSASSCTSNCFSERHAPAPTDQPYRSNHSGDGKWCGGLHQPLRVEPARIGLLETDLQRLQITIDGDAPGAHLFG
jgi:hypothetical protein